jgi:hypothetical protein
MLPRPALEVDLRRHARYVQLLVRRAVLHVAAASIHAVSEWPRSESGQPPALACGRRRTSAALYAASPARKRASDYVEG